MLGLLAGCSDTPTDHAHAGLDAGVTSDADAAAAADASPPHQQVRSCTTEVAWAGAPNASQVAIAGEFNDFSKTATPLERRDGKWRAQLDLEPGEYAYKFVVDGQFEGDPPPQVLTKWAGGVENRDLVVPDCQKPTWKVVNTSVGDDGHIAATFAFVSAASEALVDPESVEVTVGGQPVQAQVDAKTGTVTVSYQADDYGKYSLRIQGADADGVGADNNPVWIPLWYQKQDFKWQDALMYLIFTDRFVDSDGTSPVPPVDGVQPRANYEGGDFKGIIDKINDGYFDKLGVNLLWLSPVTDNTNDAFIGSDGTHKFTAYHGYWPIDPLKAESHFGDAQASADQRLKQLVDTAHTHGIRVLFDLVLNHVHKDHIYCTEHPDWCQTTCLCGSPGCGWDEKPITCQFAPYLLDLNYKNQAITRRVIKDTMTLAETFDIDGFRVDAAKHMNHIIMRRLRHELNHIEDEGGAPFYTVGETYTFTGGQGLIMNYVSDYELHGQFDFPLLWPIRGTFANDGSFKDLDQAAAASQQAYGEHYKWMSPFLGNHDIPRFATMIANHLSPGTDQGPWGNTEDWMQMGPANQVSQWDIINRMSMAFAFLLTQPGVPLIYYGDEIGMAGSGDPDNRRMMDWDLNANQQELLKRVRALGQARRAIKGLRRGDRRQLWVDDSFYVYARGVGVDNAAIIAMNKGSQTRTVTVTVPYNLGLDGETLHSYLSDREITVQNKQVDITLDPWEYAIFVAK